MKIDLSPSFTPELAKSSSSAITGKTGQTNTVDVAGESGDVARLSTGSDAVAAMRSQLDSVPDVRQDRVQALQQAISLGQFVVSPQRIATGMMADAGLSY